MNIYKIKKVTEKKEVLEKTICDKCKRTFSFGTNDKKHCGSVDAEIKINSDYHLIKDFWQSTSEMHLCYDCYRKFLMWLGE